MKRGFVIGLSLVIIISTISFISFVYLAKQRNYKKYKLMPDFSFSTIHNKTQNTSNLPKYNGYVVQIFNPECEICQNEATDYFKHNDLLQNICILMLSPDSIQEIKNFASKHQLYNTDNFLFGHIDKEEFERHFGSVLIPTLFIYNSDKKLINKTRVANSSTLLNYFKN